MKHFIDGDQVAVVHDDFKNLQESPVVWVNLDSEDGRAIVNDGLLALPFGSLHSLHNNLKDQAVKQAVINATQEAHGL